MNNNHTQKKKGGGDAQGIIKGERSDLFNL